MPNFIWLRPGIERSLLSKRRVSGEEEKRDLSWSSGRISKIESKGILLEEDLRALTVFKIPGVSETLDSNNCSKRLEPELGE